jgi:2-polyprenyl-6-hydroxyphenyl methylase / 3-demethylubiquinone-9 3-methyltransferase
MTRPVARELSDYPPPGMELRILERMAPMRNVRILEIGCGDGRLTRQLAAVASSAVAVDPDPARITAARRAAKSVGVTNVSFRVGSAERMRFGGGAFDIALFSWSL